MWDGDPKRTSQEGADRKDWSERCPNSQLRLGKGPPPIPRDRKKERGTVVGNTS